MLETETQGGGLRLPGIFINLGHCLATHDDPLKIAGLFSYGS